MPRCSKVDVAGLGGEVKAVHLVVASLMGFVYHLVQRVFSYFQFFSVEHGATKVDYLSLGIVAAHLFQKLLIGCLEQFHVVVVGGEIVGAKVDAFSRRSCWWRDRWCQG